MQRKSIIKMGRDYLTSVAADLKRMHGLNLDSDLTDDNCYLTGLRIIEANRKAEEQRSLEAERDRQYLDSLPPEERLYVILKRKYEPQEMGG